jgi:hypothetical protein
MAVPRVHSVKVGRPDRRGLRFVPIAAKDGET